MLDRKVTQLRWLGTQYRYTFLCKYGSYRLSVQLFIRILLFQTALIC
jgi:hypothetical protein